MKKLLLASALMIGLSGCVMTTETPTETLAHNLMKSGLVVNAVVVETMNPAEFQIINEAVRKYNTYTDVLVAYKGGDVLAVETAYYEVFTAYLSVEQLVTKYWDNYPEATQLELKFYRAEARSYDRVIREKLAASKSLEAYTAILELGTVIVKTVGVVG